MASLDPLGDLYDPDINWNWGLIRACKEGHLGLVKLMIANGAYDWDWGLRYACEGGALDIAELMISYGATYFTWGLCGCLINGHYNIAEYMLSLGACYNNDNDGLNRYITRKKHVLKCIFGSDIASVIFAYVYRRESWPYSSNNP